jgi:hypothetical protein
LLFLALQSAKPPSTIILESTETVGCLHQWFIVSPHGIATVINKSKKYLNTEVATFMKTQSAKLTATKTLTSPYGCIPSIGASWGCPNSGNDDYPRD